MRFSFAELLFEQHYCCRDAFYLNNRTILYKHNIEKLIGDYPISALIIDAYGEALNDDAKQNTQKQKNAYLSANNYVRSHLIHQNYIINMLTNYQHMTFADVFARCFIQADI